jgi:hypothetical protein
MDKLTDNQKQYIKLYIDELKELREYENKLYTTLGLEPEGEFIKNIWRLKYLADRYFLDLTDEYIVDWVNWYIWENDFGEKSMEAGENDNLKPIKTIDNLFEVINIFRDENS